MGLPDGLRNRNLLFNDNRYLRKNGASTLEQTVNGDVIFSGNVSISGLTQGSVLFAGEDGLLSQDNSNFFWDDTNDILKLKADLWIDSDTRQLFFSDDQDGSIYHDNNNFIFECDENSVGDGYQFQGQGVNYFEIYPDNQVAVNGDGTDTDFIHINFDSTYNIFSDAENRNVGIGLVPPDDDSTLYIKTRQYVTDAHSAVRIISADSADMIVEIYEDSDDNSGQIAVLNGGTVGVSIHGANGIATNNLDILIDGNSGGLVLGDGQDARIFYNGSHLEFDSQIVGGGDFYFANGNLGLGVAGPAFGAIGFGQEIQSASANVGIRFDYTGGTVGAGEVYVDTNGDFFISGRTGSRDLFFQTNALTRMTVDSVGDVLIAIGDLVLPKTSGIGIKVDPAAPTFGFADMLGKLEAANTGPSKPTLSAYKGGVKGYLFATGDEEFFTYHLPHDYVPGTDIHLHIHWSHISTLVTGGNAVFSYEFIYAKGFDQAAYGTNFVGTLTGNASTTQYQVIITEVTISAATATAALMDRDDLEIDGLIKLTIGFQTNNITSSGAVPDVFIEEVDIHYQSNGVFGTKSRTVPFYT